MAKPKYLDIDPPARDADGIAEAQTTATNGNLLLNGALCDLGTANQFDVGDAYSSGIGGVGIRWTSATEGVTLTVTGLNQDGQSITEVLTGAAGSPNVDSVQYYSRITQIAADGQIKINTQVGPSHKAVSKSIPLNWRSAEPVTYSLYSIDLPFNASVEEYFGDPQTTPLATDGWVELQSIPNAPADAFAGTLHARAARVVSATAGGEFQFGILQT